MTFALNRSIVAPVITVLAFSLLTACSTLKLNPFSASAAEGPQDTANATQYLCSGNQHFFVRMQNNNVNAWLIYPDHEVNLTQAGNDKNRYSSGAISLVLNGNETTLNDGEKIAFSACKPQVKK